MGWLVGSGLNIAGGSAAILGAAMGATMGFAATLINGGSLSNAFGSMLKGALFGAVSAGIANEIGNWAGGLEGVGDGHSLSFFTEGSFVPALAKAAMHGIARGVIDTIQGGKFGAGFASGFVSSGFAVSQKWGTVESRTIVMAMVGGTTSQITGGKFANGAITGAFVHLFNAEMKKALNTVSVDRNINRIKSMASNSKFLAAQHWITLVKGGGRWDYKSVYGLELGEDMGNFNYGATGAALGFSEDALLLAAGFVQIVSGTASLSYINSNFDDPHDQEMIKHGIDYYNSRERE